MYLHKYNFRFINSHLNYCVNMLGLFFGGVKKKEEKKDV